MKEKILKKVKEDRPLAQQLIETRCDEDKLKAFSFLFKNEKCNISILKDVFDMVKKEILDSILERARKEEHVYILGHKNPDADSIFSSYLLSNILKSMEINAHFSILSEEYQYMEDDQALIKDYLIEEPLVINDTSDKKFILVDHNTLEGLNPENVIGAIDHHIISNEVYDTLEMEYASTGLFIYDLFRSTYSFSPKERELVALTVLTDTEYLCSTRFSKKDQEIWDILQYNGDINALKKKYFVTTDFTVSILDNLKKNYKEYNHQNLKIKRSIISSYRKEFEQYFDTYVHFILEMNEPWLLIWANYEDKETTIYYNGNTIKLDYILTSTNLILKMLIS